MSETMTACPLVLASASPRRRELLSAAGVAFEAVAPPIPEPSDADWPLGPAARAEALAFFKARSVRDLRPDAWVLGADTLVARAGVVLGKPVDAADARRMLRSLAGTRHAVITGVALLGPGGERSLLSEATRVTMREMTAAELDQYVASGEWKDKAGAYAIQETGDRFIESIEGSFTNVVGLPMELIGRLLARIARHDAGAGVGDGEVE